MSKTILKLSQLIFTRKNTRINNQVFLRITQKCTQFPVIKKIKTVLAIRTYVLFMKLSLTSIARLLGQEIFKKGDIRYIQLRGMYVITENPFTKDIELNSLETYQSHLLSLHDLTDILEFKFVEIMKEKRF